MLLLLCMALGRKRLLPPWFTTFLLLADIALLNYLIAVNGAASNPFSAVLLVPLVLALMLLPPAFACLILLASVGGQLMQLGFPIQGHHGSAMQQHSKGMITGFIVTGLMLTAVVFYFRFRLARQEKAIHTMRERQLRDEQLLAIGTAAAQIAHDAATPVQTIRLILEEAMEKKHEPWWLGEIMAPFGQLEKLIQQWRSVADEVREDKQVLLSGDDVLSELKHVLEIARPAAALHWPDSDSTSGIVISADRTLVPALTSIIINACDAAHTPAQSVVMIGTARSEKHWELEITNEANHMDSKRLQALGNKLMLSDKGLGAGAAISNATLEKLGGEVTWRLVHSKMITRVLLPLSTGT